MLQNAVSKAKGLVLVHQEYQRGLHVFEDWLEQEQASLASLSHPEGNVDTLEKTLQQLQVVILCNEQKCESFLVLLCTLIPSHTNKTPQDSFLLYVFSFLLTLSHLFSSQILQQNCSNGQSLLSSVLTSRERVIPWGIPQIEDRALDTAQREWGAYQNRLEETQSQLHSTLTRLRQMGHRFLSLAQWLEEMEKVANVRCNRRSDRATKQSQLRKLQVRERDGVCRNPEICFSAVKPHVYINALWSVCLRRTLICFLHHLAMLPGNQSRHREVTSLGKEVIQNLYFYTQSVID